MVKAEMVSLGLGKSSLVIKHGAIAVALCGLLAGHVQASQDPTAPLGWQTPTKKPTVTKARLPQLQGIVCGELSACTVILNNVPVELGGRVSGYTLTDIQDDYVTVTRGGKKWRLELFADIVKAN
ncbi:MSHA biogenesis protein MshK [Photobacterium sp. OFAV2-7]|uniref:MSHA biogenesis protein MshK n=1 Tax=Photobacterium sp. OFAV2-7 TaxID=2917748 RepID=UPI001EF52D3C|nr:MSHA biogenesis protein MshK [Photobacterium sp. OFAV2-7]